jgi:hypothetical protein
VNSFGCVTRPSTRTRSEGETCLAKSVMHSPLIVTRPSRIYSSAPRREEIPASARKRFRRTMPNPRYASGLVLGNPITLSPGLNSPRFLSNSTRSNRLRTFRLATIVLAPFKLRCCDIDFPRVNAHYSGPIAKINSLGSKKGGRQAPFQVRGIRSEFRLLNSVF